MKVSYYKCDCKPSSALLQEDEIVEFKYVETQNLDDQNTIQRNYKTKQVCLDCAGKIISTLLKGKTVIEIEELLKGVT